MIDHTHDLAAPYVLNALGFDELKEYEQHYQNCHTCREEVANHRETVSVLAEALSITPPKYLKEQIVNAIKKHQLDSEIRVEFDELKSSYSFIKKMSLVVASFILICGIGLAGWAIGTAATENTNELVVNVLKSEDAIVTNLEGEEGSIRIVWSPINNQAAVIGNKLPNLNKDQIYELWFIHPDQSVSAAGLFKPQNGQPITLLELGNADAVGWGVTIEPAQGSEQPTSDVIYSGLIT